MGNCLETFFYVTLSKQHRDTQKAVYARFLPRQSWRFHLKRNPHKHNQNSYGSTKVQHILLEQSLHCQFFILDMNKSNGDKFLYFAGRILQI